MSCLPSVTAFMILLINRRKITCPQQPQALLHLHLHLLKPCVQAFLGPLGRDLGSAAATGTAADTADTGSVADAALRALWSIRSFCRCSFACFFFRASVMCEQYCTDSLGVRKAIRSERY